MVPATLPPPRGAYPPSKPSGKVLDTHSVGSICDHDFGVFTVTNIATENTDAVPPAHAVPRMPKAANQGLRRCRRPRGPLTCLAPLTAWQSLSTGHVDALLKILSHWPSRTGTEGDHAYSKAERTQSFGQDMINDPVAIATFFVA